MIASVGQEAGSEGPEKEAEAETARRGEASQGEDDKTRLPDLWCFAESPP